MSGTGHDAGSIVGRGVEAAVGAVVERDSSRDPNAVRAVLGGVVDDGTVTAGAVEEKVDETSLVVATAENRTEFARLELDDAREAADAASVAEIPSVRARLDRFEADLAAVEDHLTALQADLSDAVDPFDGEATTYAAVRALKEVNGDARVVQRAADEIEVACEEFQRWVRSSAARTEDLGADVDALAAALDDLSAAVEGVPESDDPAAAWADARVRTAAYGLLLADLRAELADLRAWPDGAPPGTADLEGRLDDLGGRLAALGDRLADRARPAWRDRYADAVRGFERTLDGCEPPVAWGDVRADLTAAREAIGATPGE